MIESCTKLGHVALVSCRTSRQKYSHSTDHTKICHLAEIEVLVRCCSDIQQEDDRECEQRTKIEGKAVLKPERSTPLTRMFQVMERDATHDPTVPSPRTRSTFPVRQVNDNCTVAALSARRHVTIEWQ